MACWHADMETTELAQTGRMVQERNFLSCSDINALASLNTEVSLDPRFVHPDDTRAQSQFDIEGVDPPKQDRPATFAQERRTTVLVATDAASKQVPEVRHVLAHRLIVVMLG